MDFELPSFLACGVLALDLWRWTIRSVLGLTAGNTRMQEIAAAIQEGARAYLNRQYTTIAIVGALIFVLVCWFLGWHVAVGLSDRRCLSGVGRIYRHERIGARQCAHGGSLASRLARRPSVAFRSGAVTGMLVVGLGLLGVAGYYAFLHSGSTSASPDDPAQSRAMANAGRCLPSAHR